MEQQKLTFLITHLILRLRDYPPEAVDELLAALDTIERKYDLVEKLSDREWQAVLESRQEIARSDRPVINQTAHTGLSKADRDTLNKKHLEIAVNRIRMRAAEEQGDISDLLFALLGEHFLESNEFDRLI